MFIIYVIDLSTKINCKDGGSYFYKNKKYRLLEIEKKIFFSSFQKILIFHICVFQKMVNVSSEHSFKLNLDEWDLNNYKITENSEDCKIEWQISVSRGAQYA